VSQAPSSPPAPPIAFEPNSGAVNNPLVVFVSRGPGYAVDVSPAGAVLTVSPPAGAGPAAARR